MTDSGAIDVDLNASGAVLTLDDGTTITGDGTGTLTIGTTGELDVGTGTNGPGATLDGVKVTDNGAIDVDLNASGAMLRSTTAPRSRRRHRHADDQLPHGELDVETGHRTARTTAPHSTASW